MYDLFNCFPLRYALSIYLFLSLKFLSMEATLLDDLSFNLENRLYVIIAIMYIPLFDTFRVIAVRLLNNKSPFSPDNNHIHHILINSGLSHFKSSLFLGFLNLGLAILFIFLSFYLSSFQMLWILMLTSLLLLGIFNKLKNNVSEENKFKYMVRAIRFFF